jgi:hypothetical protein
MLYSRFLARMLTKHTRHCTGVPHSVTFNDEPTVTQSKTSGTANNNEHGFERKRKKRKIDNEPIHPFDASPYSFGPTTGQPSDAMDSMFDPILNDDLLGRMNAIANPQWMQTMMLPGFVLFFTSHRSRRGFAHLMVHSFRWPTDENYTSFGNNVTTNDYPNSMPRQPGVAEEH